MWYNCRVPLLKPLALLVTAFSCLATAQLPALKDPGWDLASYVSRPDLRAPLLKVTRSDADALTPGYLFMAPYALLHAASLEKEYVPFQAGPHIYDNKGELVWSGAKLVENRNTFDFRLTTFNDSPALTFILDRERRLSDSPDGAGIILDTSYQVRGRVNFTDKGDVVEIHEFNLINGKTSLTVFAKTEEVRISALGLPRETGWITQSGFREIDIQTGKVRFEWRPSDHISLTESLIEPPKDFGASNVIWDCYHTNSIDKDQEGDYLVSIRYTSTIYKISGVDGSIIWRLGGKLSDFTQDFKFSSQHNAKFHSYNSSVTIISFLDNASDELGRQPPTARTSAVKMVALYEHTTPMTAKVLKQWDRPDGGLTKLRGQAQILPNGGVFASWSDRGYISEYAPDGRCILEAMYVGDRFDSYRGYKFNFIGIPDEPPALKTHAYGSGASLDSMSSVFAVSWNGATEVVSWTFYGSNNPSAPFQDLGTIAKFGFETTYISNRFWAFSYAQANAANGTRLGFSRVEETILPNGQINHVTLADLLTDARRTERRSAVVAIATMVIVLVGLALGGLALILLFFWKRPDSCCLPGYMPVRNMDSYVEAGEMESLRYNDGSDSEPEAESDNDYHAEDDQQAGAASGTISEV